MSLSVNSPEEVTVWVTGTEVCFRKGAGGWTHKGRAMHRYAQDRDTLTIFAEDSIAFQIVDPLDRTSESEDGGNSVTAPMPGVVKALFVSQGDSVAKGDRLAILEAMKMEHALLAGRDGVVAELPTTVGAQVNSGDVLILMEEAKA